MLACFDLGWALDNPQQQAHLSFTALKYWPHTHTQVGPALYQIYDAKQQLVLSEMSKNEV